MQPPTPLRPVQPVMITNIAGVKWYHLRCRAGFSTARTRRAVVARTFARTTVRASLSSMRLSGLGCLVDYLTNGERYETDNDFNFGNCANGCNCRRTVNIVPVGLCNNRRRIFNNIGRFVPIRIYIRRHSGQLFGGIAIGFMYYVCTNRCQLYGCIRHIRIYVRMPVGITDAVLCPLVIARADARPTVAIFFCHCEQSEAIQSLYTYLRQQMRFYGLPRH